MKVGDARAVAARWVAEHAARAPWFAGAFFSGSTGRMPHDAALPVWSDVDVMVVTTGAGPQAKLGKFVHDGVLLEVTYLPWEQLGSPADVLAKYHLAGHLAADGVIADPTGRLGRLRARVAREFSRRVWVRRRCDDAQQRIVAGLKALEPDAPLHERVPGVIFPAGVTCHLLLTAGLRNPTVRRRFAAARQLLAEHGRADFYDELLEATGYRHPSRSLVESRLRAMAEVFDATVARVPAPRTPFFFSFDITAAARPIAVDGSRDLVERGLHREAMFWIAATYARCSTILAQEAPDEHRRFAPSLAEIADDLGCGSPSAVRRRVHDVLAFVPRVRGVAERIIAANPAIDG